MDAVDVGDRYSNMQTTSVPAIYKGLIGIRLDVYLQYFIDDSGTELCWSQGEVILVSYGTNIPKNQGRQACYKAGEAVMIPWDKNEEINEAVSELPQHLLRQKWNPMVTHSHGFWIFDVEIKKNQLYSYGITRIEIKVKKLILTNVKKDLDLNLWNK